MKSKRSMKLVLGIALMSATLAYGADTTASNQNATRDTNTVWGDRVAAATATTEHAFPELSLGVGGEMANDTLLHPFMLKATERKR